MTKPQAAPDPFVSPQRVEKPWGHEWIFANTPRYAGKVLFIRAGQSLSLQYHERKMETLFVLSGAVRVSYGPSAEALQERVLHPRDVFHAEPGCVHRFSAEADAELVEVSTPELDDVVRLEDRYGRTGRTDG